MPWGTPSCISLPSPYGHRLNDEHTMSRHLTHANVGPVMDDLNILTAGTRGPALLEECLPADKTGPFRREVVPKRHVHEISRRIRGSMNCTLTSSPNQGHHQGAFGGSDSVNNDLDFHLKQKGKHVILIAESPVPASRLPGGSLPSLVTTSPYFATRSQHSQKLPCTQPTRLIVQPTSTESEFRKN